MYGMAHETDGVPRGGGEQVVCMVFFFFQGSSEEGLGGNGTSEISHSHCGDRLWQRALGPNLGDNYSICTHLPGRELHQESQLLATRAKQMPPKGFGAGHRDIISGPGSHSKSGVGSWEGMELAGPHKQSTQETPLSG